MTDKEPKSEKPQQHQPGDGIRSMRSTTLFRAVNFELYAKPVSCLSLIHAKYSCHSENSIEIKLVEHLPFRIW